jgi:hypothetical protein
MLRSGLWGASVYFSIALLLKSAKLLAEKGL